MSYNTEDEDKGITLKDGFLAGLGLAAGVLTAVLVKDGVKKLSEDKSVKNQLHKLKTKCKKVTDQILKSGDKEDATAE